MKTGVILSRDDGLDEESGDFPTPGVAVGVPVFFNSPAGW